MATEESKGNEEVKKLVTGDITINPDDPEILEILSLICLQTGPIAHVFQAGGYPIPKKTEMEQAHVLLWLLSVYRDHGMLWRKKGDEILKEIKDRVIKERAEGKEG